MKKVFLVLSLLFVGFTVSASAQTLRFLPDPSAQLIGVHTITVHVDLGPDGKPYVSRQSAGGDFVTEVGSFRTSGGRIEMQMISDSIRYFGPGDVADNTPTPLVYSFLAQEAINQALRLGFIPAADCSSPWISNVYSEPCVKRTGSGIMTRFVPCDRVNYSTWKYAVCRDASNGTPIVTRQPYLNTFNCDGYCEPTCPNTGYVGSTIQ